MEHQTLRCLESGCDFTYPVEEPNLLKTHKAKVHSKSVTVLYREPIQEFIIERKETLFKCVRCPFTTDYPSVIKVTD